MAKDDPIEVLKAYFRVEDAGTDWNLHCLSCKAGWALRKTSRHPGNILHLLNHGYGHAESKRTKRS